MPQPRPTCTLEEVLGELDFSETSESFRSCGSMPNGFHHSTEAALRGGVSLAAKLPFENQLLRRVIAG